MTKHALMQKLGLSQADVARMFGVTRAAVSQWPDDEPIPDVRLMKLKYELHPELFTSSDPDDSGSGKAA